MCGIVGAVGKGPVSKLLIDGLKKLEYRGYDSAGIAVINTQQDLDRLRVAGKVSELEKAMLKNFIEGQTGIAHTRWATHGVPTEKNAHPFTSHNEFALVHNGIIENYTEIREQLKTAGYEFFSDTDTEVIVHLIHQSYLNSQDFLKAVQTTVAQLKGAYALGILSKRHPNRIMAVRQGSPLVIGKGEGENFLASDPLALLSLTKNFIYLEDADIADITLDNVTIYNSQQLPVDRLQHTLAINNDSMERGQFRHYMKKEIMEQPQAIRACLENRVTHAGIAKHIFGDTSEKIFEKVAHVQLVACGTSYHAALVARYWIESIAQLPCSVEVASEFRYRDIAQSKNSLYVTLSQSGETADTLAALRLAKTKEYLGTLAICNVASSSMTREAELNFLTHAGVEIGVASTKAFVTQLVALFLLSLSLCKDKDKVRELEFHLKNLSQVIEDVLKLDADIAQCAKTFINKEHAIFIARGSLFPISLEGALKMKEISYIHAEGYSSGELKHGPLALVDHNMPVISCVPGDKMLEKNMSNLQEVRARGGMLYLFTDKPQVFAQDAFANSYIISMPTLHSYLTPIAYTIPLQLLAYHVAVLKGTDVDQPRNLAKSVTVE